MACSAPRPSVINQSEWAGWVRLGLTKMLRLCLATLFIALTSAGVTLKTLVEGDGVASPQKGQTVEVCDQNTIAPADMEK